METKHDVLVRMRERYATKRPPAATPVEPPAVPAGVELEKAFVVEAGKGRTVLTAPMREIASSNAGFTYLHGRLVGAEVPNGNGAMWTTEDLELGRPSVAGGPLNWLHDDTINIGCLLDGDLVEGRQTAAGREQAHLTSTAAVWRFLYPRETATIEAAAKDGQLFYSMECISRTVTCVDTPGRPGCGREVGYAAYDGRDKAECCDHLLERSSVRRFGDPLFLGAAVIVPPVKPAWAGASVDVLREAASLRETAGLADGGLTGDQALDLAATVLRWASR